MSESHLIDIPKGVDKEQHRGEPVRNADNQSMTSPTGGAGSRRGVYRHPNYFVSPELVDRKVRRLLDQLTTENFDSVSNQVVGWANKSENERDARTLILVIRVVYEKAIGDTNRSEIYARLCRKMMDLISNRVQDDGIRNSEGKPIAGGALFRKYLFNRCQEDFEREWVVEAVKESTAAPSEAGKEDTRAAAAEDSGDTALHSDDVSRKPEQRGLGLMKFICELFKLCLLTERIMHECIKALIGRLISNARNPEVETDYTIESLCVLLITVGSILDTEKARAHVDVYFSKMKEMKKSPNVGERGQAMLQDVIELRERKWVTVGPQAIKSITVPQSTASTWRW